MQQATTSAGRTIAVLSPAYFGSVFSEAEWRVAFVKDPTGELGLLVPVRVQDCAPPGLLASRVYIDLVDTDEDAAKQRLLAGVDQSGARPTTAPYPGAAGTTKRFPGQGSAVSNLPPRNRNFSGREELLKDLHASLQAESRAAVVPTGALHGLGGVGKTELALELAHRFASDYDIAWWVPAELPTSAAAALAALASRLGVEELADQSEMVAALFEELRHRDRWLLVYDNAERPEQLSGLLPPGGGGQVLVTSRWALAVIEAALGPASPEVAWCCDMLGRVLRDLGDLAGAKGRVERALAISEAALGPNHPDVAASRNNLGLLLKDLGDLEGAWVQLERALAISEAALGPNHPDVATIRGNLKSALKALREPRPEGPSSPL